MDILRFETEFSQPRRPTGAGRRCALLRSTLHRAWGLAAVLVLWTASVTSLPAQAPRLDDLRQQALACEKRGDWPAACRCYEEILRKDRQHFESRQAYQRCVRRYHLAKRQGDRTYHEALNRLTPSDALTLYQEVLDKVMATYIDRQKATLTLLCQHGIEELRLALDEESFVREYLPGARPEALRALKARLDAWPVRKVANRSQARALVVTVAGTAQEVGLSAKPSWITAAVMEFASGACNALDEYTLFVTPAHFGDAQAAQRGRLITVGIDLVVLDQHLEIGRVYPHSPAQEAGLLKHDRVVRIDRQLVEHLPADVAADRLRGETGSVVELEVVSPGQMLPRLVKVVRRSVVVPTVEHDLLTDPTDGLPIGWIRITHFHESTVQEVKEALATLQTYGMKALILDLRGNPGGLFLPAVHVTELFLSEGVIVLTQGTYKEYNRPYRAEMMNPLMLPLAVLIDGDTASAAELVAGALKENRRAALVGQTTFGKGTIQCLIPLQKKPAGIRITVARFFSPSNQPFSLIGVSPDLPCNPETEALAQARNLLAGMLKPMMPETPIMDK
jgi:carboxyl-terminal processing protease